MGNFYLICQQVGQLRCVCPAQPQATFFGEFLHPTISDQAAAYLYHIAKSSGLSCSKTGTGRDRSSPSLVVLSRSGWSYRERRRWDVISLRTAW